MDLEKVKEIFKKDGFDLIRTRGRLIALFAFPMLMIFFFGAGFSGHISGVNALVINDAAASPDGMMVQEAMMTTENRSDMFQFDFNNDLSKKGATSKIESGKHDAFIYIPENFQLNQGVTRAKDLKRTAGENIKILVDPTKSQQLRSAVLEGMESMIGRLQGGSTPVEASDAYGDFEYMDFLAPAIIVMTIFFGAGQGTGRALAGEKEEGTLDRLSMTPTSANEIIAGKTSFAVATQLIRAIIIILAISLIFGVAMNGSWLLVAMVVVLLTIASVGIGLSLSAIAEDESTYGEMSMMVILPAMFVSGIFFPVSAMPSWIQPVSFAYPLTYANNAIRKVMLMGSGIGGIIQNLLILAVFAVVLYSLGIFLFNRTARG